jgi:hypothetical protein
VGTAVLRLYLELLVLAVVAVALLTPLATFLLVGLAALAVAVEQLVGQIMLGALLINQLLALATLDMVLTVEEETLKLHSMQLEEVEEQQRSVGLEAGALTLMVRVETEEPIL